MNIQAYIRSGIIESYLLGIAGDEDEQELSNLRQLYPEIEQAIRSAEEWLHAVAIPSGSNVPGHLKEKLFRTICQPDS